MIKEKVFIYINSFAAQVANSNLMKKYLNKRIGHKNWTFCSEVVIPEELKNNIDDVISENFFHGIATHQYTIMREGGTFINPFLYGLNSDMEMWTDIIHNSNDFFQNVVYIDVPYDIYYEAAKETTFLVEEEEYNQSSEFIEDITNDINNTYYPESNRSLH